MSDAMLSPSDLSRDPILEQAPDQDGSTLVTEYPPPPHLVSPAELAAQLHANPKLAALRGGMTPQATSKSGSPMSPPILVNPKCSGYFVEPVRDPVFTEDSKSLICLAQLYAVLDEVDGTFP